ncbi:TP901 family phage tail tape measure protein [Leucobacter luti]|uniref:phage tail tape measure protein n=1 Tax=Leucobacter luti TaxID=340320 RepID=UPI001047013C|nr:phage tail tape measure protein [Leucobacter luti]MCW2287043.1 TP901 family phage tail tape measure protein [Leucobacter luti]TCK41268.1 TP901 family phage tail tape measure protein [Leucobacter luti]
MAERTTKVTLSAQVQGYVAGMEEAARATRATGTEAEKLAQQTQAFELMGRTAMVAGGAMAVGLGLSAKAAIDWDSAWAGVTKTVDGSPEQLAAVEAGLRGLTSVLPASHTEIAAVAEAAGQLGIKTPEVVAFTKTMIDLGETTNLSSEEAATSLARFMTVMGTAQGEVSGLGSALVELGNNYATTEAEIMAMSMRLAGAGNQIGMSEGQVLGLSTALSSVGIEAEAGGSAMSKVMIDIASSVEKGGDRLTQFANVAGVSAEDFAAKWKKDPGEALAAFVKGLADAESQGKSTFGILEDLGITEVRMRDALLRSASAADQFSEAMATGSEAMGENTALIEEAEKRYDTVASKLGIMRNRVTDAAISIGEHLLPAIGGAAEGIGNFAGTLSGLDGPMGAVVAWGGLVAAGILLTGGMALAAVPKIAAYKVALEVLGVSTSGVRGKLGGVASFLMGPWGAAMLAAGIATNVFNSAMDASKVSSEELKNAIMQGAGAFDTMTEKAQQNEKGVTSAFINVSQHFADLPALADKAAVSGRGFWSSMSFNENTALDAVKVLGDTLSTLAVSDLPRAQRAFAAFVNDSGLNDNQALTLMNEEMASFKSSLIDAASAAGVATDDATLLKFALGEVGGAAVESADGTDSQKASLEELAGVAAKTGEEVAALADEIRNFGSGAFDMEGSAIKLQEEYRKLADAFAEGGQSLDITTEAGGATVTALMDVAAAANASAGATLEMTGNQEAANAILDEARQKIIDARVALDESPEAAAAWADQFLSSSQAVAEAAEVAKTAIEDIPDEKKLYISADAAAAYAGIEGVRVEQIDEKTAVVIAETDGALAGINAVTEANPPDKVLQIHANAASAYAGIEGVNVRKINDKTAIVWGNNTDAVKKIDDINAKRPMEKKVWIGADDSGFQGVWSSIMNLGPIQKVVNFVTGTKPAEHANGGIHAYANGGIAAYADGGFATGIYKGGAPIHKFAEPETGWEAYISGKPSERDRNRQIWADTGARLGMSGAGQSTVYVPTSVTVLDADRKLIGTMAVVADIQIDGYTQQQKQEKRRAGR